MFCSSASGSVGETTMRIRFLAVLCSNTIYWQTTVNCAVKFCFELCISRCVLHVLQCEMQLECVASIQNNYRDYICVLLGKLLAAELRRRRQIKTLYRIKDSYMDALRIKHAVMDSYMYALRIKDHARMQAHECNLTNVIRM